jgi:hypothetical protein
LIDLHYSRGLGHRQIAEMLDVPLGNVPGWFRTYGIADGQLAALKAAELLAAKPAQEEVAS